MKIKSGKYYTLANGEVVGPMYFSGTYWSCDHLVNDTFIGIWKEDGTSDFFSSDQEPEYDIVSEAE
jgi:hypothetical protein